MKQVGACNALPFVGICRRFAGAAASSYPTPSQRLLIAASIRPRDEMLMSDVLFNPFKLKSLALSNRIVMAPMTRAMAAQGIPGPQHAGHPLLPQ